MEYVIRLIDKDIVELKRQIPMIKHSRHSLMESELQTPCDGKGSWAGTYSVRLERINKTLAEYEAALNECISAIELLEGYRTGLWEFKEDDDETPASGMPTG